MKQPKKWVTRDLDPYGAAIRCDFHTRVIVPADRTPSGTRYEFRPGETRGDVAKGDVKYLLSLTYNQSACCGGKPGPAIHYFVLA